MKNNYVFTKRLSLLLLLFLSTVATAFAFAPAPIAAVKDAHFESKTDGTTGNVLFSYDNAGLAVDFLAGSFEIEVSIGGGAFAPAGTMGWAPGPNENDYSFPVTGLADGSSYVWQIRLRSTNPVGGYLSPDASTPSYTVELLSGAPGISFVSKTNSSITVNVANTVTGTSDYRIWYGPVGGTLAMLDVTVPGAAQNYTLGGLSPSVTYVISVQALKGGVIKNAAVNLSPNQTTNRNAPAMASYFTATSTCPESAVVSFAYDAPSSFDTWKIINNSGGAVMASGYPAAGNMTATLAIIPGVVYDLRLIATNETGVSYTNLVVVAPPYEAPDGATNVSDPYDITETSMTISWTNGIEDLACLNKFRDEYEIVALIEHRDGSKEEKRYSAFKHSTSKVIDGLSPKDKVVIGIFAINNTLGTRSNPDRLSSGITLGPPWDPTDLAAMTEVGALGDNHIKLTWMDNADDEVGTTIEIQMPDGSFRVLARIIANETSFIHKPVEEGLTYVYRILAFNQYGNSGYTSEVSHTVAYSKEPAAPYNLTATLMDGTVKLTWHDDSDREKEFYVNRSMDSGETWAKIATVERNGTMHMDSDVSEGNSYQYNVVASNDVGNSDPSNVAEVTWDTTTPPTESSRVTVFPNPTVNVVNLRVPNASKGRISLINQSNRRVLSRSVNFTNDEASVDISSLAPGAYQLIIVTETSRFSKKIYKY